MSEWTRTTVGHVMTLQRGFDITKAQQASGDVPVVSSGGIGSHHDTAMVKGPGVVMGRKGTLGKVFYLDRDFWPHDTTLWVKDFKGNDPRFVYYFLGTLNFLSMDVGSSNPTLNRNHVHPVPINWPPLREQRAIVGILGTLDDKVAVNARIATTAEDLSMALVSREPERARVRLDEICALRKDQVAPQEIVDAAVDHYSLPAFDAGKLPERVSPESIKSGKFTVSEPAVLLSKLNPEIPRVWNVEPDPAIPSLASTEFLVLAPRDSLTVHELWAATSQRSFLDDLAAKVTGTSKSHQRVRPAEVMATEVVDPRQFGETGQQIRSLARRAALARQESQALATLRDTLLPQLMSGRLRVRDAEKIVEDHV
ncbi:restriction endonuclease subunit S [Kitasatospora phosalacinea]|uniref:restriction endonuclease subunit S n=1 Tax=Kitasatospora phosalacinea TaxID=2065 RepID=UPI000525169C|nr:restriction endonuclease subunit S [Kitasatospora phosalacinea]